MTSPKLETIAREKDQLYVTDMELIRCLGVDEKLGRQLLRYFSDKEPTFPKPQPFWGGRRYMPAVRAWLDARNGLRMDTSELSPRRERRAR